MRLVVVIAVLAWLAGCAPSDESEASRTFELGTGSWRFEPIEDGAELSMIRGAQGGWHVWLAFRASAEGMNDLAIVTTESQPADESRPPTVNRSEVRFEPDDGRGQRIHVGYTEIFEQPSCSVGVLTRVRATFEYPDGEILSDEHFYTPLGGAYPPPPCAP